MSTDLTTKSQTVIDIKDLSLMESIIRLCQSRGAIQAGEMLPVGILYNKLLKIIQKHKEEANAESQTAQASKNLHPIIEEN